MPYASKPDNYPPEFQAIFDKSTRELSTFEIELETYQQATSLRHQLHAYRRAAEAHQIPGWSKMRAVQFSIQENKLIVRNTASVLNSIHKTLNLAKVDRTPTEEEIDNYLKHLDGEQDD